jgi:hypothetical protein
VRLLLAVLCVVLCLVTESATATCKIEGQCDKCAKESEFAWNPGKQYVTARLAHFYELDDQVKAAYEKANDAELTALAHEYLELATIYRCNWNYGNAIHDANRYLGLASLRRGNVDEAARFLVLSGKSTGSPQLDSFGPELDLADQLLKRGQTEAVTEYLKDIKHFWEMDDGQVDRWLAAIGKGEKPSLDRFSSMKPKPWMVALQWLVMGLPAIVAGSLTYFWRGRLQRTGAFLLVSLLAAYASLPLLNWGMMFVVLHVIPIYNSIFLIVYLPLILVLVVPALVVFGIFKHFESGSRGNAS